MFAVRRALIDESLLRTALTRLAETDQIDPALPHTPDLNAALGLQGIPFAEAAYRYAAYEPGMDCVLVGTSRADHLRENLRAVQKGPLPDETVAHLWQVFARVEIISGQVREA